MAVTHYFAGPSLVSWQPRSGVSAGETPGASVVLGINREAIMIQVNPVFVDVHSDDWGGPEGAPSDAQYMGATASISLSLTKINRQEAGSVGAPDPMLDKILDGISWNAPSHTQAAYDDVGVNLSYGEFVRQGGYMGSLTLSPITVATDTIPNGPSARGDNMAINFPNVFARTGGAQNVGTRYMSFDVELEAWAGSSGTLYTKTFG